MASYSTFTIGSSWSTSNSDPLPTTLFNFNELFCHKQTAQQEEEMPICPPCLLFSSLSPPPLPTHMPAHFHLDPTELRLGSRLGFHATGDVGIVC